MEPISAIRYASLILLLLCSGSFAEVKTVVFRNVHVIPMKSETVLKNQDLIIRGDRIEAIVPTGTGNQAEADVVIQGEGKYLGCCSSEGQI